MLDMFQGDLPALQRFARMNLQAQVEIYVRQRSPNIG
jgi:hypothetical protein